MRADSTPTHFARATSSRCAASPTAARAVEVCSRLVDEGFLAGVPAPWVGPEVLLVAVTEQRTRQQIDAFAAALAAALA